MMASQIRLLLFVCIVVCGVTWTFFRRGFPEEANSISYKIAISPAIRKLMAQKKAPNQGKQKVHSQRPSAAFLQHHKYYNKDKKFWRKMSISCNYDPADFKYFQSASNTTRHKRYLVLNEPRSGSSWLQEMSQMHPGIKVQFELDINYADDALQCKQCLRPKNPDTKFPSRLPPKLHPPLACGLTMFASSNDISAVSNLTRRHNASLLILLRRNHVAHAISSYRHFLRLPRHLSRGNITVPWTYNQLADHVATQARAYRRLLTYAARAARPAHLIFYEDLKRQPAEVWAAAESFLGLPHQSIPDIHQLERRSSAGPAVRYLKNLPALLREVAVAPGGDEDDAAAAGAGARGAKGGASGGGNGAGGGGGGRAATAAAGRGPWWREMLENERYDAEVDLTSEFDQICARYPSADMRWRSHRCVAGRAVPLSARPPAEGATPPSAVP